MSRRCSSDEQNVCNLVAPINCSNGFFCSSKCDKISKRSKRKPLQKQKPAWDPCNCNSKRIPFIICKECGCAYKEAKERELDEKKLRLVDIHECTGTSSDDTRDILFSINLQAVIQYQCHGTSKVPCECQRCRKCRRKAPGDHYPDCECTLCLKRAANCLNNDYYKMKLMEYCDDRNNDEDNPAGYARYCVPRPKTGILCDCHDEIRMLNALHGPKCCCHKCMKFRRGYKQCCDTYARTNERRKLKQRTPDTDTDDWGWDQTDTYGCDQLSTINKLFPSVPQSCGHGPLCVCPSEYKAAAANITTYCRDETKPCLCHAYAPSNWDRKAPCNFQMCGPGTKKSIPIWDISRENFNIDGEVTPSARNSNASASEGNSISKPSINSKRSSGERKPSRETLTSISITSSRRRSKDESQDAIKSKNESVPANRNSDPKPPTLEQEKKRKSSLTSSIGSSKDVPQAPEDQKNKSLLTLSSPNIKSMDSKDAPKEKRKSSLTPSTGSKRSAEPGLDNAMPSNNSNNAKQNFDSSDNKKTNGDTVRDATGRSNQVKTKSNTSFGNKNLDSNKKDQADDDLD